jgi:RNA-directed DNA polymerase
MTEDASARVPEDWATHDEEAPTEREERWGWVEPEVWTERMVAALESGVKGGKWFSLRDKVWAKRTLAAAWQRVRRNSGSAGVDHQSIDMFAAQAERYLDELHEALRQGTYRPMAVRRAWIPKLGTAERRPLGIPTVKDRVVQTALKLVLEPIWEAEFADQSYGFRPRRGCKEALRRVQELLDDGATWVVDVDIQGYFDSLPHDRLMEEVERRVADGAVLRLLTAYLHQGVLDGLTAWQPEQGTPQGAVISPLLANICLDPLDHELAAEGYRSIRYADDLVVLCRTRAEAEAVLGKLREWMTSRGLTLHPQKTSIVNATQAGGFDFLGYHFERGLRWPRKKSEQELRVKVRAKTRRKTSGSMDTIVETLNPMLRGWWEYFKQSHWTTWEPLDGWIRMRLRSILRWRAKQVGRGRGSDHVRWPNAYFTEHGLFTMAGAHRQAVRTLAGHSR